MPPVADAANVDLANKALRDRGKALDTFRHLRKVGLAGTLGCTGRGDILDFAQEGLAKFRQAGTTERRVITKAGNLARQT